MLTKLHPCLPTIVGFIVDSTQYRYLDLPSFNGGEFHKPPSIYRDKAPQTHTVNSHVRTSNSIGVQLVDMDSTTIATDDTNVCQQIAQLEKYLPKTYAF